MSRHPEEEPGKLLSQHHQLRQQTDLDPNIYNLRRCLVKENEFPTVQQQKLQNDHEYKEEHMNRLHSLEIQKQNQQQSFRENEPCQLVKQQENLVLTEPTRECINRKIYQSYMQQPALRQQKFRWQQELRRLRKLEQKLSLKMFEQQQRLKKSKKPQNCENILQAQMHQCPQVVLLDKSSLDSQPSERLQKIRRSQWPNKPEHLKQKRKLKTILKSQKDESLSGILEYQQHAPMHQQKEGLRFFYQYERSEIPEQEKHLPTPQPEKYLHVPRQEQSMHVQLQQKDLEIMQLQTSPTTQQEKQYLQIVQHKGHIPYHEQYFQTLQHEPYLQMPQHGQNLQIIQHDQHLQMLHQDQQLQLEQQSLVSQQQHHHLMPQLKQHHMQGAQVPQHLLVAQQGQHDQKPQHEQQRMQVAQLEQHFQMSKHEQHQQMLQKQKLTQMNAREQYHTQTSQKEQLFQKHLHEPHLPILQPQLHLKMFQGEKHSEMLRQEEPFKKPQHEQHLQLPQHKQQFLERHEQHLTKTNTGAGAEISCNTSRTTITHAGAGQKLTVVAARSRFKDAARGKFFTEAAANQRLTDGAAGARFTDSRAGPEFVDVSAGRWRKAAAAGTKYFDSTAEPRITVSFPGAAFQNIKHEHNLDVQQHLQSSYMSQKEQRPQMPAELMELHQQINLSRSPKRPNLQLPEAEPHLQNLRHEQCFQMPPRKDITINLPETIEPTETLSQMHTIAEEDFLVNDELLQVRLAQQLLKHKQLQLEWYYQHRKWHQRPQPLPFQLHRK